MANKLLALIPNFFLHFFLLFIILLCAIHAPFDIGNSLKLTCYQNSQVPTKMPSACQSMEMQNEENRKQLYNVDEYIFILKLKFIV